MNAPAQPPPLPRWLLGTVLAVGALAFLPTLTGGFLGDDFVYVARFHDFPWSQWPRLFVREWSEGIWGFPLSELRPFSALSLMIDGRLYGGHALGYRITNLLLHLGVVALVTAMAWRYQAERGASRANEGAVSSVGAARSPASSRATTAALVAGLAFALHPAHLEPVAWITGRVDVASTLGGLGFWLLAETWVDRGGVWRLGLAGLVLAVGVFTKELALFAPPLLLLHWLLVNPRVGRGPWLRRCAVLAVVALVAVVYLQCRRAAFGANAAVPLSTWHNQDAWQRQSSYAGWLAPILPFREQMTWAAPASLERLRFLGLAGLGLTIVGFGWALVRRSVALANAVFFTTGWWLATVGGLLLVAYFSPRHLYFPSTGLCVGAGLVIAACGPRLRGVTAVLLIGWLGAGHVAWSRAWIENGRVSREVTDAYRDGLQRAPQGSLALSAVPEVRRNAWLWSWAAPQALGAPFLPVPIPPERVFTRQAAYYQPEKWAEVFRPLPAVEAAPGAVVVTVGDDGQVRSLVLSREELQRHRAALAVRAENGVDAGEWIDWVNSLFAR